MAAGCCRELKELLGKLETSGSSIEEDEFYLAARAINETGRQCKCLLKNPALILPLKNLLQKFYVFCIEHIKRLASSEQSDMSHEFLVASDKLYQAISKSLQSQYPLYIAYESVKNNFQVSEEQKALIAEYCDAMPSGSVSVLLLENIAFFCQAKGVQAISECIQKKAIPLSLASALIGIVAQLRAWINNAAAVALVKPLSTWVTRYLCGLSEEELRLISARAMAELMMSTVKVQSDAKPTLDIDSLEFAFKYFLSSTLTIRMAGLNLITNQIHNLVEMSQSPSDADIDGLCLQLANWLIEKQMIEILFGPNHHVELIKQSQFLLDFLAQERQLKPQHLDCIWAAGQMKHIGRVILDLLISLTKHLDMASVHHLLNQIGKLQLTAHTKQTLLLSSLLTRTIWTAGLTGKDPEKVTRTKISTRKFSFQKQAIAKRLSVSPIQSCSPSVSSDASTDEEMAEIHARHFSSSRNQVVEIGNLDLKIDERQIHALNNPVSALRGSPAEDLEASFISNTLENPLQESEDAVSCTNTNGSSMSDREQDMETMDEEVSFAVRPTSVGSNLDAQAIKIDFNIEGLCESGQTLLWDLIQDPSNENFSEGMLEEVQKLLWQLVCYSGNLEVRKVFIKGCVENLRSNKSVIVSFKILPKLLSVFPHSHNSTVAQTLLDWAVKDLGLMTCFFENLEQYVCEWIETRFEAEEMLKDREVEIQSRLDFLTAMYSNEISPDIFRLTIPQVDILWDCLITRIPDTYHYLVLSWLLKQTNSEELHALGLDASKHIFVNKLPALNSEKITLTGLSLFQKLFGQTRLSNASPFGQELETEEYLLGVEQLWNIALKAERLQVSNEAMNILNYLYMSVGEQGIRKEEEFVKKAMQVLQAAVTRISENCLESLKCIQQVLKVLKNHLETFMKRFAYHLHLWKLEGKSIESHQPGYRPGMKDTVLRLICQPAGVTDKVTFKLRSSDLLAVFRAEVTHWCLNLQKERDASGEDASLPVLRTPFRLISHGHELNHDLDMKPLGELGIRDQQLVYVSSASQRKERGVNAAQLPMSLQPAPNYEFLPMVLLLREENFKQLFELLDILYKLSCTPDYQALWLTAQESRMDDGSVLDNLDVSCDDQHETVKPLSAEQLVSSAWELLLLLPTNPALKNRLQTMSFEGPVSWSQLINLNQKFQLMYTLQILDSLSLPVIGKGMLDAGEEGSFDSDSSLSDSDKDSQTDLRPSLTWINKLFENGLIRHLHDTVISDDLKPVSKLDEWALSCLAYIVKILTRVGLVAISREEQEPRCSKEQKGESSLAGVKSKRHVFRARYKSTEADNMITIKCFNASLISILNELALCKRLLTLLSCVSIRACDGSPLTSQDVHASVVFHCFGFLVCWLKSCESLRQTIINHKKFASLLTQLVFFSPQRSVRVEASRGIYKLCTTGGQKVLNKVLNTLLEKLRELVSLRTELKLRSVDKSQGQEAGWRSSTSSNYKDYFWLLGRLIDKYSDDVEEDAIDIRAAILQVATYIQDDDHEQHFPGGYPFVDYCLIGLLQTCTALVHHDLDFKFTEQGSQLLKVVFHKCLFNLPQSLKESETVRPRCDTKSARQAGYELIVQLVSNCYDAYLELQALLCTHHTVVAQTGQHARHGWNYWPHEQERSQVGYVGLINLGATCYMASCMQQLFMIPKVRASILQSPAGTDMRHGLVLKEVQKMFAYLQESFRKAYNPRSFCKTYTMDKQSLNTGEQKDMTEFFTDFVSKLEEMNPELKQTIRDLFCGVITNNVISLDCAHVSKTEEEFYTVRCTVADMKNLYESLDEVTVKDVLEGDNKYTCSQCNDKVRAEKRACFRTLPRLMCFNTMRYTFNMVTMLKEKVNTHFSFPMKLNMAAYTEEYLLGDKKDADPDEDNRFWYNLAGVVVHTGTADGGHYYSFIRDRHSRENSWYLFNDAEVKTFDPLQIAAECFGGEMTTKTFDSITEKYMDFSFEKTHSAYMLFYEHSGMDEETQPEKRVPLSQSLQDWIWEDNFQFLQDKLIFDTSYFNFVWQFCSLVPKSIDADVAFFSTKLATSFLLETLVHSREKPHMKGWVELLMRGFEQSQPACEWFLDSMATDDFWLQQLFIRCPAQPLRQMFGQLCLYAIRILRPSQVHLYAQINEDEDDEDSGDVVLCSPVTRFIKSVFNLLDENLKSHCKNLSELFQFIYQFVGLGHEERAFLLCIDAISTMIRFYVSLKVGDSSDPGCEEDDELEIDDDDLLAMFPEEKFYPSVLDKMIGAIPLLLEEARDETALHLSESDLQCLVGDKEFPFIYQITADAINLRQTANIIFHLSRYNEPLAQMIVDLLLTAAQKLPIEQAQSFFKLLSLLTEVGSNGLPGLPSFINLVLPHIWKTAECNPGLCIDWLTAQVPRNKIAHKWVLDHLDHWVEHYLVADNSPRIRGGAAYLLVSLVPNNHFPQGFRGRGFATPQREWKMSSEAKAILHKIYMYLLSLLPKLPKYCDTTHAGTTRLVNYFIVLNYCCISEDEKGMFTPFSNDLWRLFHPIMSEPDIPVHFNKQALLTFWFHVCEDFEENIRFVAETPEVVSNIAYNYILSNDDQEVISYNNATLPVYYGLLRLACQHSKAFCRGLAVHPNVFWAFEYLIPKANHYPQTVDELLLLIQLFAGAGSCETDEEREAATAFRRKATALFCRSLDGQNSWTSLINVLKILLQSEEDCVYVAVMKGLRPLAEAFITLHLMYHEATACNVTNDILEILNLLQMILSCCQAFVDRFEVKKALASWTERSEVFLKAISLLNSFVSRDIHKGCIELLMAMLSIFPEECIETLAPIIHQSHMSIRLNQSPGPIGAYFPKCGSSSANKPLPRKLAMRSHNPELNMTLHPGLIEAARGKDEAYDSAMIDYFHGYHVFVDKMCRYGLNLEVVPGVIIDISCLLAVEALPLGLSLFPKLWQEVWSKSSDNLKYKSCVQKLLQCDSFIEYIDTLFTDERALLDNPTVYSFVCFFLQKVHQKILVDQKQAVLNSIIASVVSDASCVENVDVDDFERVAHRMNGDLRALYLLLSVTPADEVNVTHVLEATISQVIAQYEKKKGELLRLVSPPEAAEGSVAVARSEPTEAEPVQSNSQRSEALSAKNGDSSTIDRQQNEEEKKSADIFESGVEHRDVDDSANKSASCSTTSSSSDGASLRTVTAFKREEVASYPSAAQPSTPALVIANASSDKDLANRVDPANPVCAHQVASTSDECEDLPDEPPKKRARKSPSVSEEIRSTGDTSESPDDIEPVAGPSGVTKTKTSRPGKDEKRASCSSSSGADKEMFSDDSSGSSDASSVASEKSAYSLSAESATDNNTADSSSSKRNVLKPRVRPFSVADTLKKTCEQLLLLLKRRREKENPSCS